MSKKIERLESQSRQATTFQSTEPKGNQMKFAEATALFSSNFDQLESLGIEIVEKALSDDDNGNEALERVVNLFLDLDKARAEAMANHDTQAALSALFGLIGIGSILGKVIEMYSEEGESVDE
jgi:hypothetical protein